MENIIKNYKDEDETFLLFEKVLVEYLPFCDDSLTLKVNDLHRNYFLALDELYSISKSKVASEWNSEERLADSLAWYRSLGLITLDNGDYYINSLILKQKLVEYEAYKEALAKNAYTKGSLK